MKRFGVFILIVAAIPLLGILVASAIESSIDSKLATNQVPPAAQICSSPQRPAGEQLSEFCSEYESIELLRRTSIGAILFAFGLPILYWLLAASLGRNRTALAYAFPWIVRVSLAVLAASVLIQGAIFCASIYFGESYAIGRIHFGLIMAIGLGALLGAIAIVSQSLSFAKLPPIPVLAIPATAQNAGPVLQQVEDIATKLGSRRPDNVVIGLEPNFFATSAPVAVIGQEKPLSGETLYLSAPLLRLFTLDEFRAVVGHELGHFRGADTVYTLRFAPIYSRLSQTLQSIHAGEGEGSSALARLPAVATIGMMLDVFQRVESRISRVREHAADAAGTEASTPTAIVTALVKVSAAAPIYGGLRQHNVEQINTGHFYKNLSAVYAEVATNTAKEQDQTKFADSVMESKISHPTDSHPTLVERARALGADLPECTARALTELIAPAANSAFSLDALEDELTMLEHRYVIAVGAAKPPDAPAENAAPAQG